MVQKGMALRYNEDYKDEIEFAKSLCYDFFQIWFYNGSLIANSLQEPKEERIKEYGFPIILHAAFDINDFEMHGQRLLELLDYFRHNEVIIHPVCTSEPITSNTVFILSEKLKEINKDLQKRKIMLYVENNSVIDGFFYAVDELRIVYDNNPDVRLFLDLAHINDYEHLREIVKMRKPECIHIADKRFGVQHEHIALGKGDLDFKMIFKEIIPNYSGRIILEAVDSKDDLVNSKLIMDELFR